MKLAILQKQIFASVQAQITDKSAVKEKKIKSLTNEWQLFYTGVFSNTFAMHAASNVCFKREKREPRNNPKNVLYR